ncbi:MAG: LacI family DNA-binding transcriptional regulator [Anaerolineae bacterium]|jgi:LacI family transcriptional regulator
MDRKRVTIEDVARAAGVSRQTVSRAINDRGEISPQTRARVLRTAEEMGYRPSGIARGLATSRTHTLGLVIPDVANPFFSDVARGAEHVAYAADYNVFLCNTDEAPKREVAVLQSLEEKRVDGVVLCSSRLDNGELHAVVARHPAVVLVNRRLGPAGKENNEVGVVMLDDVTGGRMATQHLLDSGHRAVGFLAGPAASHSRRQRAKGYRAALAAADLPHNPAWTISCPADVDGGHRAAMDLLAAHTELTALFCYNDLVAVGALQACADLGYRVPDDLAVVGFDDILLAALVTPPLTTCRVPRYELGAHAMRLLLDRISGCRDECAEIVLRPELTVRASAP